MKAEQKEAVLAALVGGTIGMILSSVVNYYLVPFPADAVENALNNGVSGAISGFMSGYMSLTMYFKKITNSNQECPPIKG